MPNYVKCMMFFDDGKYGWTESYYTTAQYASPAGALADAQALAQARINMLACGAPSCNPSAPRQPCNQPVLSSMRLSLVGMPRNTLFWTPNGVFVANNLNVPQFPTTGACSTTAGIGAEMASDNPYSTIELVLTTTSGAQVKRAIGGVPKLDICDGMFNAGSTWASLAKIFVGLLCGGKWGAYNSLSAAAKQAHTNGIQIKNLGYSAPPNTFTLPVQDALGHPYVQLVRPLALAANGLDPCNLHLVVYKYVPFPPTPSINYVYRAFGVATPTAPGPDPLDTFLLRKRFAPLEMFCPGWVTWVQVNVDAFVQGLLNRPMKKDRGRPTGLVRGRARVLLK